MGKDKALKADAHTDVSKSKAKREARRKQVQKAKRDARAARIAGIVVAAAAVLAVAYLVGRQIYIMAIRTAPGTDYSAGLTEDGRIEDADMGTMVSLADYKNIPVPEKEVEVTEEEVEGRINSTLEAYKELSTDTGLAIADGDEVNIDYVGTVDGVEFEGGNSGGTGYNVTIGSGTLVDDFEQQLIGHKPGEEMTVEVTFPEDYNEEMAGKDAVFAVTVNGIMVTPELTDDFVAKNLAETEEVSTAAEYRAKVEDEFRVEHLGDYLGDFVVENSTVNSYPGKYVKAIKSLLKYGDNSSGTEIGNEITYEKELTERARETADEMMIYQAIFEDAGLSFDAESYFADLAEEMGEDYLENMKKMYGTGYLAQGGIRQAAIDYLVELYK